MGIIAAIFFIIMFNCFDYKSHFQYSRLNNFILQVGMSTLEIYIIHSFILEIVLSKYLNLNINLASAILLFMPISVSIIIISLAMQNFINIETWSKKIIFGK